MKVKELKKYLKNFNENDTVSFSVWMSDGAKYFTPNIPCCEPIKFQDARTNEHIAVVGCNDYCVAHQAYRK